MMIKSILMAGLLLVLALPVRAASDGTDSDCIVAKDGTLFNQCNYAVDVGFCVENPRQTRNFYDSSEAFRCPNGGLSTLGPGKKEGNILNGTVHWFACATKYRGGGKWGYVKGSGYRGHCTQNASDANARAAPGALQAREPEAWGEAFECNDWIPDKPETLRTLDSATGKLMCKTARSASALDVAARAYTQRKNAEVQAAQRKHDADMQAEQRQRDDAARNARVTAAPAPSQPSNRQAQASDQGGWRLAKATDCIAHQKGYEIVLIATDLDKTTGMSAREIVQRKVNNDLSRTNAFDKARVRALLANYDKDMQDYRSRLRYAESSSEYAAREPRRNLSQAELEYCFLRARLSKD